MPTLIYIPLVYLIGWITIQLIKYTFIRDLQDNELSLIGTFISFILFLILLPSWVKLRWRRRNFFKAIGLSEFASRKFWKFLLRGILYALILISLLLIILLLSPWGTWIGLRSSQVWINAILLGVFVGFAEEIIFRSWLWGEMNQLVGEKLSLPISSLIFSLVHIRFDLQIWVLCKLLLCLFILGLVLSLIRIIDHGSLFGCIGFHGALVSGWFIVSSDLVKFSSNTPEFIFGHGGSNLNPMSGILTISLLTLMLLLQRNAFAIDGEPFRGARNASSKGASP